jgi:arylsulfatase A-like enzyme
MTLGCGDRDARAVRLQGYNLLFVTIDTMRADRLDPALTPRLHELAREGISFDHVLSHVPLTLPAHASLFTGTFPTRHGVHDNGTFRLDGAHETLAAALKRGGYETSAFVGAFVLDARFGLNRGFDHYDDYYGEKRAYASFTEVERKSDAVLSAARAWLEPRASATDAKWFAWIHLAVELDPRQFDALFNLAMALTEVAPSDARPYLERFVREAPPTRYRRDIEKARALLERGSGYRNPS